MRRPRAVVIASFLPKMVMRIVKFQPITEWNRFCGLIANDRKDPSDLDEFNGFGAWSVFYAVLFGHLVTFVSDGVQVYFSFEEC